MFKTNFRVTVRIGFHQFHAYFENANAALNCFNAVAVPSDDVEIEGELLTLASEAHVDDVTIQRSVEPIQIGNPNRR